MVHFEYLYKESLNWVKDRKIVIKPKVDAKCKQIVDPKESDDTKKKWYIPKFLHEKLRYKNVASSKQT